MSFKQIHIGVIERAGLWLASVSTVGAIISYTRGDGDTVVAVMDREAEISPKEEGGLENREKSTGQGRGE